MNLLIYFVHKTPLIFSVSRHGKIWGRRLMFTHILSDMVFRAMSVLSSSNMSAISSHWNAFYRLIAMRVLSFHSNACGIVSQQCVCYRLTTMRVLSSHSNACLIVSQQCVCYRLIAMRVLSSHSNACVIVS